MDNFDAVVRRSFLCETLAPPDSPSRHMKKTGSDPASAPEPFERIRLQADVAKQRVRIAKEELKRARKRLKEAKREARRARKHAAAARKAFKRARRDRKGRPSAPPTKVAAKKARKTAARVQPARAKRATQTTPAKRPAKRVRATGTRARARSRTQKRAPVVRARRRPRPTGRVAAISPQAAAPTLAIAGSTVGAITGDASSRPAPLKSEDEL